ncbi:MAG: hypothetical protein HW391_1433 [Chloroflexi bacterium]|nr:hypothetical protein [Chloroflexota bacterium]
MEPGKTTLQLARRRDAPRRRDALLRRLGHEAPQDRAPLRRESGKIAAARAVPYAGGLRCGHPRGSVGQVVSPRVCKTLVFDCGSSILPRPTSIQ